MDSASDPDQEYIYTLWGRKRILLPVTYFPTNLVYPFTLRVTVIKILIKFISQVFLTRGNIKKTLVFPPITSSSVLA